MMFEDSPFTSIISRRAKACEAPRSLVSLGALDCGSIEKNQYYRDQFLPVVSLK